MATRHLQRELDTAVRLAQRAGERKPGLAERRGLIASDALAHDRLVEALAPLLERLG